MDNLKLVIVLCRHGDRTPLQTYPNNPHTPDIYQHLGPGELTNLGKKRMFEVGKKLRKRYEKFLSDTYTPEKVKVITTNINRTKMTAQLVCAGLFPPSCKEKWDNILNWQPIPYSYSSLSHNMLVSPIHGCESFRQLYREVEKSQYGQEIYQKFDSIFRYLEEKSGISPFRIMNAFHLYMVLTAEESFGLVLPEWTKEVFPEPLNEIACYQYLLQNYNLSMKQKTTGKALVSGSIDSSVSGSMKDIIVNIIKYYSLITGAFLSELINDFDKKINNESKLKFILYSAHECSIANLLIILNLFDLKVPNYGSYVALELREHNNEHFIQIYYQNSENEEPKLLKIPEFDESCRYDLFKTYLSKYIIKSCL
ncbi:venom acid phosphatase Acph-1-like [Chrysoperla carnea]|uniref:venom acid phosphatase Acph-1-like n=1 Tax=Chrysoperla carnea TaxID=189513 RepID=UPI001D08AB35|nr:venom acid phosphatase Acph-1-like [Chrysoperla carnea]